MKTDLIVESGQNIQEKFNKAYILADKLKRNVTILLEEGSYCLLTPKKLKSKGVGLPHF